MARWGRERDTPEHRRGGRSSSGPYFSPSIARWRQRPPQVLLTVSGRKLKSVWRVISATEKPVEERQQQQGRISLKHITSVCMFKSIIFFQRILSYFFLLLLQPLGSENQLHSIPVVESNYVYSMYLSIILKYGFMSPSYVLGLHSSHRANITEYLSFREMDVFFCNSNVTVMHEFYGTYLIIYILYFKILLHYRNKYCIVTILLLSYLIF